MSLATLSTTAAERTLAVFYSTSPFIIDQLKHHLSTSGLVVQAQVELVDEELEEAGLEGAGQGEDVKHWTVVLGCQNGQEGAVKLCKELMHGAQGTGTRNEA